MLHKFTTTAAYDIHTPG